MKKHQPSTKNVMSDKERTIKNKMHQNTGVITTKNYLEQKYHFGSEFMF